MKSLQCSSPFIIMHLSLGFRVSGHAQHIFSLGFAPEFLDALDGIADCVVGSIPVSHQWWHCTESVICHIVSLESSRFLYYYSLLELKGITMSVECLGYSLVEKMRVQDTIKPLGCSKEGQYINFIPLKSKKQGNTYQATSTLYNLEDIHLGDGI
mmetsp:Transcript_1961/g.2776  ORF Transcript_1961/g.2776 Transcript_1961/m.2776 type:complete len:155 (+) Transcript_1961:182-646(+)